jgi:hypothetical protein
VQTSLALLPGALVYPDQNRCFGLRSSTPGFIWPAQHPAQPIDREKCHLAAQLLVFSKRWSFLPDCPTALHCPSRKNLRENQPNLTYDQI